MCRDVIFEAQTIWIEHRIELSSHWLFITAALVEQHADPTFSQCRHILIHIFAFFINMIIMTEGSPQISRQWIPQLGQVLCGAKPSHSLKDEAQEGKMRFLELLICCDKKIMTKTSGSLATSCIVDQHYHFHCESFTWNCLWWWIEMLGKLTTIYILHIVESQDSGNIIELGKLDNNSHNGSGW